MIIYIAISVIDIHTGYDMSIICGSYNYNVKLAVKLFLNSNYVASYTFTSVLISYMIIFLTKIPSLSCDIFICSLSTSSASDVTSLITYLVQMTLHSYHIVGKLGDSLINKNIDNNSLYHVLLALSLRHLMIILVQKRWPSDRSCENNML